MYKVMLVDDETLILSGIKFLIDWEKNGCVIAATAGNGQDALEKIRRLQPDIVLADINMPVMDGYEATQEIRKYSAKVPIIAVTAFAYASDEQRVMENGFDGYMPKPINARQLKAQITEIMQKRIILL